MTRSRPETRWNDRFAQRTKRLKSSIIRELLKLTQRPEVISFAGGPAFLNVLTGTFAQRVAYETAKGGFLDRHVRRVRQIYGARREAMLASLSRHFPDGARWTKPEGGLFLWVTLPEGIDTLEMPEEAVANDVAYVPGAAFFANGGGENTMRLNFSYGSPERIEEGIRRLAEVVRGRLVGDRVS